MAGTIQGLGRTQRLDPRTGGMAVAAPLYIYQAGTSTPAIAYRDYSLSTALPWPILTDGYGLLPPIWVPDGTYRARMTTADAAIIFFDDDGMVAVGPSSGGGGGGSSVDPYALFQTGFEIPLERTGTLAGWVRQNGLTIGSASSGATERANADTQALYEYLWNGFTNTRCPVTGGRGGNAAADWAANKPIALPSKQGVMLVGADDMGGVSAGRLTGALFSSGNATTVGSLGGEATHTLLTAEMPSHTHTPTVTDPGHHHSLTIGQAPTGGNFTIGGTSYVAPGVPTDTSTSTTGITVSNASTGGGGAHNNMPPFVVVTFYMKL